MSLLYETHDGFPGGMNVALPQFQLDETECRYLQDMLVDLPGITRMRGGLKAASGIPALTYKASGIAVSLDPQGSERYAVLEGNNSNGYLSLCKSDLSGWTQIAWPHSLPTAPASSQPYTLVDAKAAFKGGAFIGTSSAFNAASPNQALGYWRGGNKANYTVAVTTTRGSSTVTCAAGFTSNVSPGMWLFANTDDGYTTTLIGCVKSVDSNTSLTLTAPSPYPITALSGTFQSLRGVFPRVVSGRVTCSTSDTTINGGATKFLSEGLSTGSWNLYRASDSSWIGKVSSVTNDLQLVLTSNANVACTDEAYFAIRADGTWTLNNAKLGFLTAVYAGRQWYANLGTAEDKTSRVWFSDENHPENVDMSEYDGSWLFIESTSSISEPIRALAASSSALCVFKETEVWGIYGSTPDQFIVRRIHDDGVLHPMAVQNYGNGVVWAGRRGVYFYDGMTVTDLTAPKFGKVWADSIKTVSPDSYRMYSALIRNHYLLFIEALTPTIGITKGATPTTPSSWTVCLNLSTGAFSLLTNLDVRGAVVLPTSSSKQVYFLANSSSVGKICDGSFLFDGEGTADEFACDTRTAGPDGYVETKKWNGGDAMRIKHYRYFGANVLVQGGSLTVDTVTGLNEFGASLTDTWSDTTHTWATLVSSYPSWSSLTAAIPNWQQIVLRSYAPAEQYFGVFTQHISFRIYKTTSAVTWFRLGPLNLGFKPAREGRL